MPGNNLIARYWQDLVCVVFLIATCLLIGEPRCQAGIDFREEGLLAYGTERVVEGQTPNLDFVSLQPPLSFYTSAAVFKVLGTSLGSLRIFGLALYVLIPLLVFGITRLRAGPALAMAAAIPAALLGLPYFDFVPFGFWQGIAATAAAVLLYLWATRSTRALYLAVAAGVLTAAALLFRVDQGVYLILSIVAGTLALRFGKVPLMAKISPGRLFCWWLIGLVIGLLPWVIYWGARGALPDMYQQLIVFPLTSFAKTGWRHLPHFKADHSLTQDAVTALFYFPPLVGLLAAIWLVCQARRRVFAWREASYTLVLVWTALFYLQLLARPDLFHLLITLTPFFILCAWGWGIVLEIWEPGAPKIFRTLSVVGAAMVICYLYFSRDFFLPDGGLRDQIPVARAGVTMKGGLELGDLIKRIQNATPKGQPILCVPFEPMFYFLAERKNPTHWNYLWPGDQSTLDHITFVHQAQQDPPGLVVVTGEAEMQKYAPGVVDYIHNSFVRVGGRPGFFIYAPKPPPSFGR